MDHVAIMKKSWGLTGKILSGEKTIESRWYKSKHRPWSRIKPGDKIYVKDSGGPVYIRTEVSRIIQAEDLTPAKVGKILKTYGRRDGIEPKDTKLFFERFKRSKYCLLMFLKNPERINPFRIDKSGFGAMSAWITVGDIKTVKK